VSAVLTATAARMAVAAIAVIAQVLQAVALAKLNYY